MRRVQDDQDVVPDSEPEREQRRKQISRPLSSWSTSASAAPLELDVHSALHVTSGHTTRKLGVQHVIPEQPKSDSSPIHTFRACPSPPPIATIESLQSSDSDQEGQVSLMQISRFAYQPPSKHMSKPVAKPQNHGVRDPGPSQPAVIAGKTKQTTSKTCPDVLPETQLTRLLKCIGCGLQWTSRKTVKQKRVHIEQCAKKNSLTKETIRILIQKEIDSSTQSQSTSSSGAACGDCDENATTTLMDSVVPTGPTKKTKRQQVIPTVRSLPETRETILNRARDLLATPCRSIGGAVGGPLNKERVEIQSTQAFGRSLLARRNTADPNRPALLEANRVVEGPMGTQPFGASSLGGVMKRRRLVDDFDDCSPPSTQQFGASKLAQASRLENDGFSTLQKRPISPPPIENNDRAVRQRLLH